MGYAGENPLRFVDPTGLADCGIYDNHGEYTEKTKKSAEESKKKQQAEQNYWHMQFMKFNNYGKYPDENWNEISYVIEDSIKSLINLDFGYDFSQLAANAWENGHYLTYLLAILDSAGEMVLDCFFACAGAEYVSIGVAQTEAIVNYEKADIQSGLNSYVKSQCVKIKLTPAEQAANWQGSDIYPGVDSWTNITIKKGSYVWGGLPGQSEFYTTTADMLTAGNDATKIFKGLQVSKKGYPLYRGEMGMYQVPYDMEAAISQALANTNWGSGGFTQLYIPEFKNLNLVDKIALTNR